MKKWKEHDFNTTLNLFHLADEIDVEEEPPKESQNMLDHHEIIKPKVNEFEDINL